MTAGAAAQHRAGAHGHADKTSHRLHHPPDVTRDMEATRKFYEDVIGLPLVATWSESDELFGAVRTYCHCFFGLGDGGALAFFQFANPGDQELFGPEVRPRPSVTSRSTSTPKRGKLSKTTSRRRATEDPSLVSGTRLLPLRLRHRSRRHDPGIHAGSASG